ncbi:MAG: complex I NDUFA9 subunit family protein [Caulobacteraceae bacterium]|nr:complex I NDUFA9 subunit family protein [Caulobacteraceae bacterium]
MQGLVTVFGGSGFVGTQVVRALAKRGLRIRVAVRRPGQGYKLRMLGDVGQIEVVQANIRAPETVARALAGAEACVNLVGVGYEAGRQKFQSVHAMGANNVAEVAAAVGITRMVQVSAIGADPESPSKYARTKAMGEAAVRQHLPSASIVRPSIVFGQGDGFFNMFAKLAASSPVLPLFGGGHTRFQPVFVGDVAAAVAACVIDPATEGRTYELGGPAVYSFRQLIELVCKETGRSPALLPLPFPLARLIGLAGDLVALSPFPPTLTSDRVELLRLDNVVAEGAPGLAELGVQPTALEPILPTYLYRYRRGGQYADLAATA